MSDQAQKLFDYMKHFYREPAFGKPEDFVCGVIVQTIHDAGFTDEDIQELVDLGLIERYGHYLTAYKLTRHAADELMHRA